MDLGGVVGNGLVKWDNLVDPDPTLNTVGFALKQEPRSCDAFHEVNAKRGQIPAGACARLPARRVAGGRTRGGKADPILDDHPFGNPVVEPLRFRTVRRHEHQRDQPGLILAFTSP